MPEKIIRNDATWYADKLTSPSFIKIKLLPQMMESIIKMNQFKNPCFKPQNLSSKGAGFATKYLKTVFLFLIW